MGWRGKGPLGAETSPTADVPHKEHLTDHGTMPEGLSWPVSWHRRSPPLPVTLGPVLFLHTVSPPHALPRPGLGTLLVTSVSLPHSSPPPRPAASIPVITPPCSRTFPEAHHPPPPAGSFPQQPLLHGISKSQLTVILSPASAWWCSLPSDPQTPGQHTVGIHQGPAGPDATGPLSSLH